MSESAKLRHAIFVIGRIGDVTTPPPGGPCGRCLCGDPPVLLFSSVGGTVLLCKEHAIKAAADVIEGDRRFEARLFGPGGPLHNCDSASVSTKRTEGT